MFDWIWNNREWLFSGAGIAVLGVTFKIVGLMRRRRIARAQARSPLSPATSPSASLVPAGSPNQPAITVQHVHPAVFRKEASRMPLSAQQEFLKSAIGLRTRFDAELWAVERRDDKFWVQLADLVDDDDFFLEVPVSTHAWLAVAKKGTRVVVEGTIVRLGIHAGPNLSDATINPR
jgi:hypothetical protein